MRASLTFALALSLVACGEDPAPTDGGMTSPDASEADSGPPVPGPRPDKRSDVQGVWDEGTGAFVIFGGDDGPIVAQRPMAAFRSDTWLYTPGEGWAEIEGAGPSARARYATAYGDGRMFLFGGRYRDTGASGDYRLFNDLWAFDFASQRWEVINDSGFGPAPRYFATAAYDEGSSTLYVAGGGTNANALRPASAQDLWSWNGSEWTEIPTSGDAPSPRLFEAWAHDTSRNRLVAFGGQVGDFFSPAFDDLYALDLATGEWSQLDPGGSGPLGRFNGMLAYDADNDRYLLFGGHADPGVTNDLWAFDPNGGGWSVLAAGDTFTGEPLGCLGNMAEIPQNYVTQDLDAPERRQGGFFEIHDGRVWLFGGESDCSDHLDDIWTYDLATNTWAEVLEARSGETCDRRDDDCMCLCL